MLLAQEMVYNPKELIYHYLAHNSKGAWDTEKCKKFVDSTVREILKSILVAETLNHRYYDRSVETLSITIIPFKVSVSSSYVS